MIKKPDAQHPDKLHSVGSFLPVVPHLHNNSILSSLITQN